MNVQRQLIKTICLIGLLLGLSACSTIKSYFPDKEKEYVNSIEIAPLVIPPDLSDSFNTATAASNATQAAPQSSAGKVTSNSNIAAVPLPKPARKPKPSKVKLLSYSGGASRLQIDEPFVRAWRIVGKSLSRKSLEVIDRNINAGTFLIQYDPDEKDIDDGSLWDEFLFIFGDDQSNEKEYQIRLVENQGKTEVLVLDKDGVPLSSGIGMNLLTLMHETIKADLAENP